MHTFLVHTFGKWAAVHRTVPEKACRGTQAFSAWIHICAVRLFVESILRYGLPPKFLAALMKPHQKTAPKLRKLLAQLFGSQGDLALLQLQ